MFEVKSRSPEAWGPLADSDEAVFHSLISYRQQPAKATIKHHLSLKKKLKKYKVTFIRELVSDSFEIESENEYSVNTAARDFFKSKQQDIEFKMKPTGKWAGDYTGYDRVMYVKVSK